MIEALQHIFSSVERGYFPQQGRGFQTVALSEELAGTPDLRTLEDAAFYTVSRERRAASNFPIKETFFRLPSGRFAIGRTINTGVDSLGREGNYLTHHLVIRHDDVLAIGANPFALLDSAKFLDGDADLTPRLLPPFIINAVSAQPDFSSLESLTTEFAISLIVAAIDARNNTILLIGDERRSRRILQSVFGLLAMDEKLRLTFSTRFYESHHLRSLFRMTTVRSPAEAPSQRHDYLIFDLDHGQNPRLSPSNAYADWLAECIRSRQWAEIVSLNDWIDGLRTQRIAAIHQTLPPKPKAYAALWERAEINVVPALVGNALLTTEFLRALPSPTPLSDALLEAASPSELCGFSATPDAANACIVTLHTTATKKVWQRWANQWRDDLLLQSSLPKKRRWWQFWKR